MYASQFPSRTAIIHGETFLFFSGTAYLGIPARPDFGALVMDGIQKYGTNFGSSRLSNIAFAVFDQMEQKLAYQIGAESVLLTSSGTLAGRLLLEVLGPDYEKHFAPNAHIAINPKYNSHQPQLFDSWIDHTIQKIKGSAHKKHLITFNSIDALTALRPTLDWIIDLPADIEIILIADDSHGMGIIGENGTGIFPILKKLKPDILVIASLGKALGLPAGMMAGPASIINQIKVHPLFGGSSPMVPAYAYAYLQADSIYKAAYHALQVNIHLFNKLIEPTNLFQYDSEFPVYCTQEHGLAAYLESKKIKISHFAYPSPSDPLYTRVVLNSMHTSEDIYQISNLIKARET